MAGMRWSTDTLKTLGEALGARRYIILFVVGHTVGLVIAAVASMRGRGMKWVPQFPYWEVYVAILLLWVLLVVTNYATKLRKSLQSPPLLTEISALLKFPNAAQDMRSVPTLLEGMVIDKRPRRLFDSLVGSNERELQQIPNLGARLIAFRKAYYEFREQVMQSENDLLSRIGRIVSVRLAPAWKIYLQYAIQRFSGTSKEEIEKGANFLNYSITWGETERAFGTLASDATVESKMKQIFSAQEHLVSDVDAIKMSL